MSNKKNKKYVQKKNAEKKTPLPLLAPLIAILAIIPLITYMHQYNTNLDQFDWYTSYASAADFFLYWKMFWAVGACIFMLFCMFYMFLCEDKKAIWSKQLIPLAVYCGISLLSAIVSPNRYFSFHGIYEQFEPVWMLLGYGIIVYYAFYMMRSENALKRTLNWFTIGIVVMALLGLSQTLKHDFFRTALGQKLMTPSSYTDGPLEFSFEIGRPYLSQYNPNYVGFYTALIIPVLVALVLATKTLWKRIGYGILAAVMVVILFASQSRAGIIAIVFSFLVMLVCMHKVFLKNWKVATGVLVSGIVIFIVAFFAVNKMSQGILVNRLSSMFNSQKEVHALKSIETNDDNVTVKYNDASLIFKVTQDSDGNDVFSLTDNTNKKIDFTPSDDKTYYTINDTRFPFTFTSERNDDFNGFSVVIEGNTWYFSNLMKSGDSTYYCMGGAGALMKLAQPGKSIKFLEDHYSFANMRGYIWARTIPLLKKYFLLGSGPDTFIIAFPNNDLVGMTNSGHINEIITKPHCMYLQTGVQTGVPSLIALLIFFGWYLVSSIRLYWKNNFTDFMPYLGVGMMAAVIGYLILALTNDSCVTVAPVFYAIIGMGLGINHKVKADQK